MGRGWKVNPKPIWNKPATPVGITTRRRKPMMHKRVSQLPDLWNRRYSVARCQARFRREEWAFTPETWYATWCDSGRAEQCGPKPDDYCLVRVDRTEAWGPHNCIVVQRRKQLRKLLINSTHRRWRGETEQDWSREEAECWDGNPE